MGYDAILEHTVHALTTAQEIGKGSHCNLYDV